MPELNCDIPVFECLVRNEFLYNFKKGQGEFSKAVSFAVASVPGRAVGFHCLLDNGACYGRLPIHALTWAPPKTKPIENVSELQLWDAPSEHISCITYDFLKESRCHVLLPGGEQNGTYMFTLDWFGNSYSESAGSIGWKSAHFIKLDNGYFALQPNNKILFHNPSWVKMSGKPDYSLTTKTWKCEQEGITADEKFFY